MLERALAASPLDYGYPVTTWTVADLTDLLRAARLAGQPRHGLAHACSGWATAIAAPVTTYAIARIPKPWPEPSTC